jgi:NTE family protein
VFGLASTLPDGSPWTAVHPQPDPAQITALAEVPTSFSKFPRARCEALVQRGWWLAGASITRFHPHLVPEVPAWTGL